MQRRFIKKHLATNGQHLRHKFIKDSDLSQNRRFRRDDSNTNESQESPSPDVETVLTDLADQDIVEVDNIMDDIYDEIKDLQVTKMLLKLETNDVGTTRVVWNSIVGVQEVQTVSISENIYLYLRTFVS